jgi:hypothetical protein
MANYSATRRLALQYQMTELMNMPEFKRKPSAVLQMLLSNGQSLIDAKERVNINNIKNTDQDTVTVKILNKQASSSATVRAAAHTGSINDSTSATLSFITRAEKFKYSVKQADRDSVFTLQEMIAKQMFSAISNLHDTLETYYLAWLNTNKSQVVNTPTLGTWDGTNYIFGVDDGDQEIMFQRFKGFMREQYYKGQMQLVSNEFITQKGEFLSMQGGGNAANLGWQMSDISNFATSELANFTGYQGQGFLIPFGTVGLEPWIPNMNKDGFGTPFATGGAYYSMPDPLGSGLTFAVHEYATAADNDSNAGETQDIDIQVEVSIDTAPVKAIETTSSSTPIYKVGLLT